MVSVPVAGKIGSGTANSLSGVCRLSRRFAEHTCFPVAANVTVCPGAAFRSAISNVVQRLPSRRTLTHDVVVTNCLLRLVVGVAVVAVLVAGCTKGSPGSSSDHAAKTHVSASVHGGPEVHHPSGGGSVTSSGPTPAAEAIGLGTAGVTARWVHIENAKPGTTAWRIPRGLTGPAIVGFAGVTQATEGATVKLYVSTAAPSFQVMAYRMGYYGGDDARLIWSSPIERERLQPKCALTPGVNTVFCRWAPSVAVRISPSWPQGDYLFKLVATGGQQSYVPLTVSDPASRATYFVQNSDFTWQAWNTYGGYDLYGGGPPGKAPTYDDRARVVSFDRPYVPEDGAGDFVGNEWPLVEFVEQHDLDVTYDTDIATTEDPSLMLQHRVFLSLGHDECWTMVQRQGAIAAIAHGVNFVFFAASPVLRHVRLEPDALGPDRNMVDYRDPLADPIYAQDKRDATGNTWAQPPANAPASVITGNTYGGYGINDPLVIADASAWPFAGTGVVRGTQLPHVVAHDFDHYVPGQPGPRDVQILAHSPVSTPYGIHSYADMTYYTDPTSEAGVIATGTNAWIASLTDCAVATTDCPAAVVQAVTANILRVFGSGPAGLVHPSISNVVALAG